MHKTKELARKHIVTKWYTMYMYKKIYCILNIPIN